MSVVGERETGDGFKHKFLYGEDGMELRETSQESKKLSVAERILLVEETWDGIAADQESLELTDAQEQELDRRLEAYHASPPK
ncbi:MAG: addiction module protein [Pseudomonadota bacterium]